ncbi:uncharacterized protein LOC144497768 [Mustelus asterias]
MIKTELEKTDCSLNQQNRLQWAQIGLTIELNGDDPEEKVVQVPLTSVLPRGQGFGLKLVWSQDLLLGFCRFSRRRWPALKMFPFLMRRCFQITSKMVDSLWEVRGSKIITVSKGIKKYHVL